MFHLKSIYYISKSKNNLKKKISYVQIFDCPLNEASLKFISHGKIAVTYTYLVVLHIKRCP